MSVGLSIEAPDLERLQNRLLEMSRTRFSELLDGVGGVIESETRRRITSEKTSPSGERWAPWSQDYAKTRHGNQSLLVSSGALVDSIQELVHFDELEVGSNLAYARNHQKGTTVPKREFLGLSHDNEAEIMKTIDAFIDRHIVGPLK